MVNLEKYGIVAEKGRKYENILYVLALIHNILEKELSAYFLKHKMTVSQYNILMAVAFQNEGKGLNQVEIGQHLISTPGNITKQVDILYRTGWVSRTQNPKNRRENIIKITSKGRDIIEELWPQYDVLAQELISFIPKRHQEQLAEILQNWFVSLSEHRK